MCEGVIEIELFGFREMGNESALFLQGVIFTASWALHPIDGGVHRMEFVLQSLEPFQGNVKGLWVRLAYH